jgi:hypothetical protein
MKRLFNNIVTAICLVSITANLNACGRSNFQAMPEMTADTQYTALTLDEAPIHNQLLIKFNSGLSKNSIDTFHAKYGIRTLRIIPVINVYVVETPIDIKANQLVEFLGNDPLVKYAEVNTSIELNPDSATNPVYTISTDKDYSQMIGKQTDIKGIYKSSRSGAVVTIGDTTLSIVDLDGTVVTKFPGMTEGTRVVISGVIKEVKGFNVTKNLGIMPVSFNKAK